MPPTRSWIYHLTKDQIIKELERLGISSEGTTATLRHRLSCFASQHPEYSYASDSKTVPEDMEPPQATREAAPDAEGPRSDMAKIINQIRKWGCHFDGKDPLSFLERVEELQQGYGFSGEQLLMGLPELLRGETLLWYRNNRASWTTWEEFSREFRQQYLPRRYRAQIVREIQGHMQRPDEPFHKYATAMLTNMRRAGGFSQEDQIDRLYENMSPEYKLYVRLDDISSLSELSAQAAEYEAIEKQRRELRNEKKTATGPAVAAATYSREECCWKCKQRGHTRFDCKRPPKKFCSRCGKDGVLTKDCHPFMGNTTGAGEDAATPRSPTKSQ